MEKVGGLVNLLINVVMGIVLGITGQILQGGFSFLAFCQSFILSMGVGYLIGSYIPVMDIGKAFAHLFGAKKRIPEYVLSSLAISLIMIVLITFFCVFVQAGPAVLNVFFKMIGPFLIVGTIAIELSLHWLMRLAEKIYSK